MERGDVVRVELPWPKGKPGREQAGIRPAVVVQATLASANLSTVIIVPLTSNQAASRFAGSFLVRASAENGLDTDSIVLTQQIRALDIARIESAIGVFSDTDLKRLENELRSLLGL
jgi:mRNA-degrading endonuclease toxin of MazEF toxin-antitoxin module